MVIARIALGKLARHFRECLRAGDADAYRHAQAAENGFVKVFAPCLEIHMIHAVKYAKAFINGVTMKLRTVSSHDIHQPSGHIRVELIVRGEGVDLLAGEELSQLEERGAFFDAELLRLIAAGHHAPIIIGQDDNDLSVQIRTERALTTDVAVVDIDQDPISTLHCS